MQPLFENKKGLITGVFNKQSIAWAIAERILEEGGTCGFSYMPDKQDDERKKNLGRVTKLKGGNLSAAFLYPMDVTNDEQIADLMKAAHDKLGKLDFLLHSIAFALPDDLKGDTIDTSRAGFKLAMEISAYSLIALAKASRDISSRAASLSWSRSSTSAERDSASSEAAIINSRFRAASTRSEYFQFITSPCSVIFI